MFVKEDYIADVVDELLQLYEVDELFEELDITLARVLEILIEDGHVAIPPYLERDIDE